MARKSISKAKRPTAEQPLNSVTRSKADRKSRAEKTRETRRKLLHAASELIGEEGYARATIAKITSRADLSLGTFYTYFKNREDLFDQLLPLMGNEMLDYVGERLKDLSDPLALEEAGLQAFFDFLLENPGFYRLLNEAETVVPAAFHRHFSNISKRYVLTLTRLKQTGYLEGYDPEEFEVLVYMLMAARNYLAMRYSSTIKENKSQRDVIVRTYVKFVSSGFCYGIEDREKS